MLMLTATLPLDDEDRFLERMWLRREDAPAYNGDEWISHAHCMKSHMEFVLTHRSKDQLIHAIQHIVRLVQTKFAKKVKFIQLDDHEQELGNEFHNFVREEGIEEERSASYSPQKNGSADS